MPNELIKLINQKREEAFLLQLSIKSLNIIWDAHRSVLRCLLLIT